MNVDLNKLDSMLNESLNKETTESLNEWIKTKEPQFSLTEDEVVIVRNALRVLKITLGKIYGSVPEIAPLLQGSGIRINNLLTRIKQWQDENTKTLDSER